MAHHGNYRQWPLLTEDEFELACAYFDQRYIQAKLGPTRQIFKISPRRALTTGATYIEIIRLLHLPEDHDDLLVQFDKLTGGEKPVASQMDIDIATAEEEDEVGDASFDDRNPN
jgi:ubiquitin-like-conjugating enzyme ATG10